MFAKLFEMFRKLCELLDELVELFELFASLFELFASLFGELFGMLVSNIPRASLHIHRTLHHAHTVAITFSFLCGLTYCVRTLVTVSAKLSRA